jgi:hypothetical protein
LRREIQFVFDFRRVFDQKPPVERLAREPVEALAPDFVFAVIFRRSLAGNG